MRYVVSWFWSFTAGGLAVAFVVMWVAAAFGVVMGAMGAVRRRCPWYAALIYTGIIVICMILQWALFWLTDRIALPDVISTAAFWAATALGALWALTGGGLSLLREVWKSTNGSAAEWDRWRTRKRSA